REPYIKDDDFYRGEEPNIGIITRELDVIKSESIKSFTKSIYDVIESNKAAFVPVFFITGDFGIGKSTFTLRLLYELEKQDDFDLVAFEIIDFNRLRRDNIIELIRTMKSKNLVFYCDEIE